MACDCSPDLSYRDPRCKLHHYTARVAPRPVLAPDKVSFDEALRHAREGTFYDDYDRIGRRVNCLQRAHFAMQRFCDRVEAGEVRSRRTYGEFCDLLGRARKA